MSLEYTHKTYWGDLYILIYIYTNIYIYKCLFVVALFQRVQFQRHGELHRISFFCQAQKDLSLLLLYFVLSSCLSRNIFDLPAGSLWGPGQVKTREIQEEAGCKCRQLSCSFSFTIYLFNYCVWNIFLRISQRFALVRVSSFVFCRGNSCAKYRFCKVDPLPLLDVQIMTVKSRLEAI